MRPDPSRRRLTPREREVALLVAEGLKTFAIARRLGLAPATVVTYVKHVQWRLELSSRAEIVAWVQARTTLGDPDARLRRVPAERQD
jgi:DNA-binding CsgD family transcriptional regulator